MAALSGIRTRNLEATSSRVGGAAPNPLLLEAELFFFLLGFFLAAKPETEVLESSRRNRRMVKKAVMGDCRRHVMMC